MPDDEDVRGTTSFALLLSVTGCMFSAVGYTMQKAAHRRAAVLALPFYRCWEWVVGLLSLVTGSVFAIVVLGLAGQAELAPMGAVTLIATTLLSWRVLGDRLSTVEVAAISLMGTGTTLALVFADRDSVQYNVDQITALWSRPIAMVSTCVAVGCVAAAAYGINALGKTPVEQLPQAQAALDAFGRGFISAFRHPQRSVKGDLRCILASRVPRAAICHVEFNLRGASTRVRRWRARRVHRYSRESGLNRRHPTYRSRPYIDCAAATGAVHVRCGLGCRRGDVAACLELGLRKA